MNSPLLQSLGLGGIDIAFIFIGLIVLIAVLAVLLILQNKKIKKLTEKYDKFMEGQTGRSLENQIMDMCEDQRFLKSICESNSNQIKELYRKNLPCIQKMGMVKYDAFRETGGKLSFCIALLDEEDNGFILNSVHSTEGCFVYTKRVKKGACDISLGDEEKTALDRAMKTKGIKPSEEE